MGLEEKDEEEEEEMALQQAEGCLCVMSRRAPFPSSTTAATVSATAALRKRSMHCNLPSRAFH